jgi:hypothetical protein
MYIVYHVYILYSVCTSGCLRHPLHAAKRAAVTGKWTAAMSAAVTENGRPLQAAVTVQVQEVGGGRDGGRYCNCTVHKQCPDSPEA